MPRIRILIADGAKRGANYLEYSLKSLGYDVIAAISLGKKVVKKVAEFSLDLVLMDILERATDGIRAAKKIGKQLTVPTIYLIPRANEAALQRARLVEPFGYIIKPFYLSEL